MRLSNNLQKISVLSFLFIICPFYYLAAQPAKLILIDPLVETEHKNIVNSGSQKVVILPAEGNPLKFISGELGKSGYDEIHLYMLTKPGSIIFDELNIIPENVEEYSADFSEWKNKLKEGSEIIIHSESLTSEPEGLVLVSRIREFTGKAVIVKE